MLRLPRKTTKQTRPGMRKTRLPTATGFSEYYTTLYLVKSTKLSWKHFEALRLKLARTVTAKRKISKRAWFKQGKNQQQRVKKAPVPRQKKHALIWYSGFPHLPFSAKGRGSRMGKGRGNIKYWYFKGPANHAILHIMHANQFLVALLAHKAQRLLPCKPAYRQKKFLHWR